MKRLLVVSDIHGEADKLNQLLKNVKYMPEEDQLILLGDYVDRGPNSKEVIEKVIKLREEGAIVLRGNHDEMLIHAFENREGAWERWMRNGALTTLQSYDPSIEAEKIPECEVFHEHVAFLKSLDYYYETDNYIFVHAGVEPNKPIEETDPWTLVWIREEFFEKYNGKKTVIFGHTPTRNLHRSNTEGQKNYNIYFGENNIIGIDGAAVYGGQLNCLELPSKKTYFVR